MNDNSCKLPVTHFCFTFSQRGEERQATQITLQSITRIHKHSHSSWHVNTSLDCKVISLRNMTHTPFLQRVQLLNTMITFDSEAQRSQSIPHISFKTDLHHKTQKDIITVGLGRIDVIQKQMHRQQHMFCHSAL